MKVKPPGRYPTGEELMVWAVIAVLVLTWVIISASVIAAPFL